MKKIALCKEYKITFTHEVLYLITFFLFAFVRILDTSLLNIDFLSNVVFIIVCATLAVLWITYDKVSVKKLLCQIIIISAFLLVTITTTRKYLLIYALFLLASNCAEFKKIVKYSLIATLSATCIVMIASQIGIVQDYVFERETEIAHSMGFSYYSAYPYILMFNMLSYMYIRKKSITWIEIAVLLIINQGVYHLSTLRLTYYLTFLIIILYLLVAKMNRIRLNHKAFYVGSFLLYPLMLFITVWSSLQYTHYNLFWRKLDDILSGRLRLQHKAFDLYSVKLFGQYIETNNMTNGVVAQHNYFYIDSGFIYSILGYGILLTFILLFMYSFLLFKACQHNDKVLAIWIVSLAIFTVVNNTWLNIHYNCLLLLFPQIYFKGGRNRRIFLIPKNGRKNI